jgi:hypothetical protein
MRLNTEFTEPCLKAINQLTEQIIGAAIAVRVLIGLKTLETVLPVHQTQLLSYMRESGHEFAC